MRSIDRCKHLFLTVMVLVGAGCLVACVSNAHSQEESDMNIKKMNGFPDEEKGYSLGVSACYSGTLDGKLVMAGGCNFPDKPVAEGGQKRFYKGIYTGEKTNDSTLVWMKVGELPMEAAYGISISLPHELILIGGSNFDGGLSSVYALSLKDDGGIVLKELPSLPCAMDNMAGAVIGNTLYVVGGNKAGIPSSSMFSFCMDPMAEIWQEEQSFPGMPRVQPVCAALNNKLYIWGGFSPALDQETEATVATDGYCYSPCAGSWVRTAESVTATGVPITLTGGVAAVWSDSLILCTGGVNKDIFLDAISGKFQKVPQKDYLLQPQEWYQFNGRMLAYHVLRDCWTEIGESSCLARAGAALVNHEGVLYSIGGELKPGIRSAGIDEITFNGY